MGRRAWRGEDQLSYGRAPGLVPFTYVRRLGETRENMWGRGKERKETHPLRWKNPNSETSWLLCSTTGSSVSSFQRQIAMERIFMAPSC